MTKRDQIKILNNKIRANEAQFILDRKNAKISAKSSGELDKYEYLTAEDLGYKPDALTQAKFEYSPVGKVFTAGLDKDDKKDGLFKRLKNIEKIGLRPRNICGDLDLDYDFYALNRDRHQMVKLYKNYELMDDIENKFKFLDKVYELINEYKNSDKFESIDKKNQCLSAALKVYNNILNRYKIEYLENIEDYDKEQKIKYDYKNLKDLSAKDLFSVDLSWIDDNELFKNIKEEVFDRYKKDNKSPEPLSIVNYLDMIDNEYIKDRADTQKEITILKQNVSSGSLKEIVKYLESSIFGNDKDDRDDKDDKDDRDDKDDKDDRDDKDDKDDRDDGDDKVDKDDRDDGDDGDSNKLDAYEESIGERESKIKKSR